jgi:hypothetical protein
MALGINYESAGGGDFLPIVKYDARAGKMFRVDRVNGESQNTDISRTFKAVFDLENLETGWIDFESGAPQFAMSVLGSGPKPEQPGDTFREGVRFIVKLGKDCGGDIREFASTAKAFMRGLDQLHDEYKSQSSANAGKLPIVSLEDTVAITSGEGARKSTNYAPKFKITGWVSRPDDLVHKERSSSAKVSTTPPSTGSTKVSAPAGGDDDFG